MAGCNGLPSFEVYGSARSSGNGYMSFGVRSRSFFHRRRARQLAISSGTPRPTPSPAISPAVYVASEFDDVGSAVTVTFVWAAACVVACANALLTALLTAGLTIASSSLGRNVRSELDNLNMAELFLQFAVFIPQMNSLSSPSFVQAITGILVLVETTMISIYMTQGIPIPHTITAVLTTLFALPVLVRTTSSAHQAIPKAQSIGHADIRFTTT